MGVRKNKVRSVAIPFVMKACGVSLIHSTLLAVHVKSSIDRCHVALIPHLPSILIISITLLAFLLIVVLPVFGFDLTTLYFVLVYLLVLVDSLLVFGFLAFPKIAIRLLTVPALVVIIVRVQTCQI